MKRYKLTASQCKDKINPNDFYLREQKLHKLEARFGQWAVAGLCPFHVHRSIGSFKFNIESGGFICFSCGAEGGDIIAFTMAKYNLSFYEALMKLANEGGVC